MAGADINFALRLWQTNAVDIFDLSHIEVRYHGLLGQSIHKTRQLCGFIRSLKDLLMDIESHVGVVSFALARGEGFDPCAAQVANVFQAFASSAMGCMTKCCTALSQLLTSASNACVLSDVVTGDSTPYTLYAPVFMQSFAFLKDFVTDSIVLHDCLQAYLDVALMSLSSLSGLPGPVKTDNGNDPGTTAADDRQTASLRVLVYTLGTHLIMQSRKSFLAFAPDLRGVAAAIQCEHNLRASISIFCTAVALGESDFLRVFNLTIAGLVRIIFDKFMLLLDWMQESRCGVSNAKTLVSVHILIHFCIYFRKGFVLDDTFTF